MSPRAIKPPIAERCAIPPFRLSAEQKNNRRFSLHIMSFDGMIGRVGGFLLPMFNQGD